MTTFFIGSEYAHLLNKRNKIDDIRYSWGIDCNINGIDLYVTDNQNEKLKDQKSFIGWCYSGGLEMRDINFHDLRSMVEFLGTNRTEDLLFAWQTYTDKSIKGFTEEKLITRKRRKLSL